WGAGRGGEGLESRPSAAAVARNLNAQGIIKIKVRRAEVESEGRRGALQARLAVDGRGIGVAVVADAELVAGDQDHAGVGGSVVVGLGPVAGPGQRAVVIGIGNRSE